jgi:hypothetical protein
MDIIAREVRASASLMKASRRLRCAMFILVSDTQGTYHIAPYIVNMYATIVI